MLLFLFVECSVVVSGEAVVDISRITTLQVVDKE